MQINLKYFASLKDEAGVSNEKIETDAKNINELFEQINSKYKFSINKSYLKAAKNEEYVNFDTLLADGDTIVFIPPVAGG